MEANSTVILLNRRTGEQVTVAATADGRFSGSISAQSGDQISIQVQDRAGNLSVPLVRPVGSMVVKIVDPLTSASLDADTLTVQGTYQGPGDIGITVNGVPALLDNQGHFAANHVPLSAGGNQLTAFATTLDGSSATDTVSIQATGNHPLIQLEPSQASAVAPAQLDFTYRTRVTGIARIRADLDGDGRIDIDSTNPNAPLHFSYPGPGLYQASLVLTDANGTDYGARTVVLVMDRAAMDTVLTATWNRFIDALNQQNKQQALVFLNSTARNKYGPAFDLLLPHMPEIVGSFSSLQPVSLTGNYGEYAINRIINGENRIWLIYFLKDGDGVWRLDSM